MKETLNINHSSEKYENALPHYVGDEIPNCDYTHGQIKPFPGVKCYQIVRANRSFPKDADGTKTTYKHAPDIAVFNDRIYVQYLVNEVDEHEPGGYSILASSSNAEGKWEFKVSFPPYRIPKCVVNDYKGLTHEFTGDSFGFMHQRMSFYKSGNGRMLLLGFYGWSPEKWMTNWDNYGIGRVVREIYPDGNLSDIYFIKPNYQAGWKDEQLLYPLYSKAEDSGFIEACKELLSDRLYTQQWAEENGDIDDIITIKHPEGGTNQAFCWYHIDKDHVIGLWKHSKVAESNDGGKTWSDIHFEPSLVMSGQKIWGQKCKDEVYALIYDPTLESTHRYPLCIITGKDGIHFDNMRLIHGEVPHRRYKGFWKDFGPQYMRGITEGIVDTIDCNEILLVYSVNKEDIWISRIPVASPKISDDLSDVGKWNIYAPTYTKHVIKTEACSDRNKSTVHGKERGLTIAVKDYDPVDHFVLTHVLNKATEKEISFSINPKPTKEKPIYIELLDDRNMDAVRLTFKSNGTLYVRTTDDIAVSGFDPNKEIDIKIKADCRSLYADICAGETEKKYRFFRAVKNIAALKIYTGSCFESPTLKTDSETLPDLPKETERRLTEASEFILSIKG